MLDIANIFLLFVVVWFFANWYGQVLIVFIEFCDSGGGGKNQFGVGGGENLKLMLCTLLKSF